MRSILFFCIFLLNLNLVFSKTELFCFDFEPNINDLVEVNTGVSPSKLIEKNDQLSNHKFKSKLLSFLSSKSNFYSFFSDGNIELKFPSLKDEIMLSFKNIYIISEYAPLSEEFCSLVQHTQALYNFFCSCSYGEMKNSKVIKSLNETITNFNSGDKNNVFLYNNVDSFSHTLPYYLSSSENPNVCIRESLCTDKDKSGGTCKISIPNLSDSPCLLVTYHEVPSEDKDKKLSMRNYFNFSFHIPTLIDYFPTSFNPNSSFTEDSTMLYNSLQKIFTSKESFLKNTQNFFIILLKILKKNVKNIKNSDDIINIFKQFIGYFLSFTPLYLVVLTIGIIFYYFSKDLSENKSFQLFLEIVFSIFLSFIIFCLVFHK